MEPFSSQLHRLRTDAQLTNKELARLADVPESLISGLQNNNRRVGEYQARKIGNALKLSGHDLESFVYAAIDTCSEKVLVDANAYPSQLLNLLAVQLKCAGISAESIRGLTVALNQTEGSVILALANAGTATIETFLQRNNRQLHPMTLEAEKTTHSSHREQAEHSNSDNE